jgi:mannose-6-phosphate isomerase
MFYPILFEPIYKNAIWGGRSFETLFKRRLPSGIFSESWEVSSHKNGNSIIKNGKFKGQALGDIINLHGINFLGTRSANLDRFPLLIKFIDANDKLSVQVHPDNKYALEVEGDLGKTEMWYIVDAKENAQIIYGIREQISKDDLLSAAKNGDLENYLNYIKVKKGAVIFIPSGTVHAILDGIVIAEIQQNSDTTYRLYDWNRLDDNGSPRDLHIGKAIDVINFDFNEDIKSPKFCTFNGYSTSTLVQCDFFNVDLINIMNIFKDSTSEETFFIFTAVEGDGTLTYANINYDISMGSSFLIPANCGEFTISGNITLLKSYI